MGQQVHGRLIDNLRVHISAACLRESVDIQLRKCRRFHHLNRPGQRDTEHSRDSLQCTGNECLQIERPFRPDQTKPGRRHNKHNPCLRREQSLLKVRSDDAKCCHFVEVFPNQLTNLVGENVSCLILNQSRLRKRYVK